MVKTESEIYFERYLESRGEVFYLSLNERSDWGHKSPDYAIHLNTSVDILCEVKEVNGFADIGEDFLTTLFRKLTSKVKKANKQIKTFNNIFGSDLLGIVIIYVRCFSDSDKLMLAVSESFSAVHNEIMRRYPKIAGVGFLMNDFRKHEKSPKLNPIVSFKRSPNNYDPRIDLVEDFFKK